MKGAKTSMSSINNFSNNQTTIIAPPPSDPEIPPSIYSVQINEGETVEWQWLELPDGHRVVTNYSIYKVLD